MRSSSCRARVYIYNESWQGCCCCCCGCCCLYYFYYYYYDYDYYYYYYYYFYLLLLLLLQQQFFRWLTGYSEYSLLFASLSPVYVGGASDVVSADGATAVAAAAARATAHGFDWIEPSRLHKVVTNNNAEKFQHLIHGTNWYAMGCRAVEACLRRSSVAVRVLASLAVRVDSATLPLLLLLSPPPMPLQSYRCHPGR